MSKKIFRAIICVAMIVMLASLFIASTFLYDYYNHSQSERLTEELSLASIGVERSGTDYFENYNSTLFRFTLILPDGTVVYDSEADADKMENHINREEITEAIKTGYGSSARYSQTLTRRTFYEAVKLSDGKILRISTTQVTIGALFMGMFPAICLIILVSVITAILLSQSMAKSIVRPLEQLDLDEPKNNDTYEELTPILTKLNKQHKQILKQVDELKRKSDEFNLITSSMNEGLILLDRQGYILSINSAAQKLFNADPLTSKMSFISLDRSPAMTRAVEKAQNGKHSEFREEISGGEYQFMITPTKTDNRITGAVILCIDVTEKAFAERNRQEFTANVSHELKTPLQSIIGSAELLENNLVRNEDKARFIGNIKTEATRLVSLINDIIRLSQLDENATLPIESVNFKELVTEVVEILTPSATKRNVTITTNCESVNFNGVRRYLYEVVYNLCDNAIRYNKSPGDVFISVESAPDSLTLTVRDTGVGIPPEHRARIFERFYRVDKSHSKETGGTGLGLSIVKHAVAYHGGTVSLDSTVDIGTTITVSLPIKNK